MDTVAVQGEFSISADREKLDLAFIYTYLTQESYWAQGVSRDIVERSIQHSLCFGVYHQDRQIGFARAVTDYATFAWIADVFITPAYRKQGLSKWLVQTMREHPQLQGLRRWMLATADAHGLYAQYDFTPLPEPARFMQIHQPYKRP